eukprot:3011-Heterococcus_DN1.PRE.1
METLPEAAKWSGLSATWFTNIHEKPFKDFRCTAFAAARAPIYLFSTPTATTTVIVAACSAPVPQSRSPIL